MDFHFLVMEKSWKISVEKRGHPALRVLAMNIRREYSRQCEIGLRLGKGRTDILHDRAATKNGHQSRLRVLMIVALV